MAITPFQLPAMPAGHAAFAGSDFDRLGDKSLRFAEFPVELFRFTGDGVLTTKTVQTGFSRVFGGIVFNVTDGTNWSTVTAVVNASSPGSIDLASIPADTDVYLLIVWGDKAVAEQVPALDAVDPTAPVQLDPTVDSDTEITLAWQSSSHFGSGVDGYQYRIDGGSAVDVGNVLTAQKTGLTAETEYDFEIRAYATHLGVTRYSAWSNLKSATTEAA